MTIHDAVALLRRHNEWRRGAGGEMVEPRNLGLAIDIACDYIEQMLGMVRAEYEYSIFDGRVIVSDSATNPKTGGAE
jgi:hypothetical protein